MLAGPLVLLLLGAQAQSFADLVRTHTQAPSDEYRVGAGYAALARQMVGEVDDPKLRARIERIARRVLAASDRPDMVMSLTVADDPQVNATAFPGGFLMVNRGAAELFTDDELAFVLGHELAHVQLRHHAGLVNVQAATESLSLAQATVSTDPQAARAAMAELERLMVGYGRQLELEADLYGLLYAARAGVPVAAASSAIRKLQTAVGPVPEALKSQVPHPDYAVRLAELQRGHETLGSVRWAFDAGVMALEGGMDELAIDQFKQFLTLFPRSAAGWTNLAAAHLRLGLAATDDPWLDRVPFRVQADITLRAGGELAMDRARDACARAMALDPQRPECLNLLGVMARHTGDLASARALFARAQALEVGPPDPSLRVNRGVVEAVAGQHGAALALWAEAEALEPGEPWARANRAVLLERQGDRDGALAIWQALHGEGRLSPQARRALARLGTPTAASAPISLARVGELTPGMPPGAVRLLVGEPERADGDDAGFQVLWMWPSRGLSALFLADRALGYDCWGPCSLQTAGLSIGSPWSQVVQTLGPPTELRADPLAGGVQAAWYEPLGLTVFESADRVSRLTVWGNPAPASAPRVAP